MTGRIKGLVLAVIYQRRREVSLEVIVKERHVHCDSLRSLFNKQARLAGRYLVLHHCVRVLADVAVHSEPVEAGVVRVAVVVVNTQLHQAPSLHTRPRQPEGLE